VQTVAVLAVPDGQQRCVGGQTAGLRPRWAKPDGQPSGTSGATIDAAPPSNGVRIQCPNSSPLASWNHTTPAPSGVGTPSIKPTGSSVMRRRSPVERSSVDS
jgi:hypothetical protein